MLQIVNAATGQWRVLFATLAGTGMRCGEAFGLHVEDVDLAGGRIYIRRSVRNGQEGSLKTAKSYREVEIEPTLVEILATHLGSRTTGRVFQTVKGTPFCRSNIRRKLNQILKTLGLAPAGLHALRHGRVSYLRQRGVPEDLIRQWVGHSNLQTTSRYMHFDRDYRERVALGVGLFSGINAAQKLQFSPNSPNFGSVAASEGVA